MIAELGCFALILALGFAALQVFVPALGLYWQKNEWINASSDYVWAHFIFLLLAFSLLALCFLNDDFTVIYVLSNSSIKLPWFYKMCAVWGGHEGSILLWALLLSTWTLAVHWFGHHLEEAFKVRVLIIMGALSIGFLLFIITTSNPFLRQFSVLETEGRDLNPLLQDPGFLFHPPLLYMGYVGFSVAFSFAIASLWLGRVETTWAQWSRPWTLAAWSLLTIGITLGSWWAYRELGWGGWWFWDPVENASFMPWLVGTALIHSLAVTEKKGQLSAWTVLLSITAFSLSLVGTFLVRSGVLTSVHAFAVDPERGLFILGFLVLVIGGSLALFAMRGQQLKKTALASPLSREGAILINNIFLSVMMLSILLGTVYPLLIDGLGLGKLSVGAPYFNAVFIPLALPMFLLMSVATSLKWHKDTWAHWMNRLPLVLLVMASFTAFIGLYFLGRVSVEVILGVIFAIWIIIGTMALLFKRLKQQGFSHLSRPFMGMVIAHLGIAVSILGVAVSSGFGIQKDVRLAPGETVNLRHYQIQFIGEADISGPNYHGTQAKMRLNDGDQKYDIYPEKRIYDVTQMAMTDSAIDVTAFRDVYVAMGEPLSDGAWSFRIYFKPLVRWIWAGGFMILLGGFFALADVRYYVKKKTPITSVEGM